MCLSPYEPSELATHRNASTASTAIIANVMTHPLLTVLLQRLHQVLRHAGGGFDHGLVITAAEGAPHAVELAFQVEAHHLAAGGGIAYHEADSHLGSTRAHADPEASGLAALVELDHYAGEDDRALLLGRG